MTVLGRLYLSLKFHERGREAFIWNYKSRIMKNLFNYWFKTNKKSLYDQLGKEFNVSGFRVYKLAHGKTAHSHMDRLILEKLLELKIISEIGFRI